MAQGETNVSQIAREIIDENNLNESFLAIRSRIRRFVESKAFSDHPALLDECETVGIDPSKVTSYWWKGKHFSINVRPDKVDFEELIRRAIESVNFTSIKLPKLPKEHNNKALRVVLSDMHVGLDAGSGGMFGHEYSKEIFEERVSGVISEIRGMYETSGGYEALYIDDMGDGLDGYEGQTTRGGHKLQQNLTTEEQFEVFVQQKLRLIISCRQFARKIICRNVTEDNHAGTFSRIANRAIQMVLEAMKVDVEFIIIEEFIEHFEYGDHCHIITHGKDSKHMFKSFPLKLTGDHKATILEYITHHKITSKYIHFDKGDLHQRAFEKTAYFGYTNFMSFAPPSLWVQRNFGISYSGYTIQEIPRDSGKIKTIDIYFE